MSRVLEFRARVMTRARRRPEKTTPVVDCVLYERGVYELPFTIGGGPALVAVDARGEYVHQMEIAELGDYECTEECLWGLIEHREASFQSTPTLLRLIP